MFPLGGEQGMLRPMTLETREVGGVVVPSFFYGTAWKEDRTEALTKLALEAGFVAIDTANQRRHYFEAGVGAALSSADRATLFLQTKFTYARGQDHRLPYDPAADPATQVRQSFASSLEHLHTSFLDSYVLHGPSRAYGLDDVDWQVWRAMEELQQSGKTKLIGVSNISIEQLALLFRDASVKPAMVQNRCFAATGWDREVRAFCREHGIGYQGFSLLTANGRELGSDAIRSIARRTGYTLPQLVFRFALEVGMIPLTGTSSAEHMREDLATYDLTLGQDDVKTIEAIAG
jgi:diketogulonate reductase-like aldo/keto reductase